MFEAIVEKEGEVPQKGRRSSRGKKQKERGNLLQEAISEEKIPDGRGNVRKLRKKGSAKKKKLLKGFQKKEKTHRYKE